jgi:hypothetical protein
LISLFFLSHFVPLFRLCLCFCFHKQCWSLTDKKGFLGFFSFLCLLNYMTECGSSFSNGDFLELFSFLFLFFSIITQSIYVKFETKFKLKLTSPQTNKKLSRKQISVMTNHFLKTWRKLRFCLSPITHKNVPHKNYF